MKPPSEPLFLARRSYRRRRLGDAARLLPLVGVFLILMPALWADGARLATSAGGVFIFIVWTLLILAAAALSRPLGRRFTEPDGKASAEAPREDRG